jgi:hypothetical protein
MDLSGHVARSITEMPHCRKRDASQLAGALPFHEFETRLIILERSADANKWRSGHTLLAGQGSKSPPSSGLANESCISPTIAVRFHNTHSLRSRGMEARLGQPGVMAALGAAILFGAGTPLAKSLLEVVDPWLLAGLLYLGSGLGLTAYR